MNDKIVFKIVWTYTFYEVVRIDTSVDCNSPNHLTSLFHSWDINACREFLWQITKSIH